MEQLIVCTLQCTIQHLSLRVIMLIDLEIIVVPFLLPHYYLCNDSTNQKGTDPCTEPNEGTLFDASLL